MEGGKGKQGGKETKNRRCVPSLPFISMDICRWMADWLMTGCGLAGWLLSFELSRFQRVQAYYSEHVSNAWCLGWVPRAAGCKPCCGNLLLNVDFVALNNEHVFMRWNKTRSTRDRRSYSASKDEFRRNPHPRSHSWFDEILTLDRTADSTKSSSSIAQLIVLVFFSMGYDS